MADSQAIRVDPELQALCPPLAPDELKQLEANVLAEGCRDPLVVWAESGVLLDGHNRLRICEQHGLPYETAQVSLPDQVAARVWVRNHQLGRRNLTDGWRIDLALGNKADLAAVGAARRAATLKQNAPTVLSTNDKTGEPSPEPHNTRQAIAQSVGMAQGKVAQAEIVRRDAPDLWERVKTGEETVNGAYKKCKKDRRKTKQENAQRDLVAAQAAIDAERQRQLESVCDLRICSCRELLASGIRPDAVITDPPYPKEFLPAFSELAEGCKATGVPLVAVMSGQSYLPEVMARLCEHLPYRWTMAYLTPGGQAVQQWQAKVNTTWKPVMLFGSAAEWLGDVATSKPNDNDKRFHQWGQSESGMADLVERLTKPNQLICDPFLGGGTTAVVALALGRRFVGCDIDAASVEQTRARVMS